MPAFDSIPEPQDVTVAGIQFKKGGKIYYFDPNGGSYREGEAVIVETARGTECGEVVRAIRWHTTGHANMTKLEKIVYLADMIEPNRTYPGVDAIREAAARDLDAGVLLALERTIAFLQEERAAVCETSIHARDWLLQARKEL